MTTREISSSIQERLKVSKSFIESYIEHRNIGPKLLLKKVFLMNQIKLYEANAFSGWFRSILTRYFICRWLVRLSCSIVQNLVANYHLVISYTQQCHIGMINVNYWYVITIGIHIILLFAFSQAFELYFISFE